MVCINHTRHKGGVVERFVRLDFQLSLVINNIFVAMMWPAKQRSVSILLCLIAAHL